MPKLTIDDQEIEVADGLSLIQACKQANIEIPHFCFHEKLKIAGNCRMCLVEVEKSPKLVASCAMPVSEGMVVRTNTPKVKKGREGVMEFLLINHPLDCPICDQGGECDLQDQAFKYGSGKSRYTENKRSVKDKNLGPLVKTQMTRCIHCTRCIRFSVDVAGVPEMGATGRGEHMEVVSYLEKSLSSELSGNMIDICPVGALTSKPYAFHGRSWELVKTESIDVMDALGSNIRVDSRGMEVMRILPKANDEINEEWISDKARFSYDGLKNQRLDRPYVRKNGKLVEARWGNAFSIIADKIGTTKPGEIASIAGTLASAEGMFLLKKILHKLGSNAVDANQFGYKIDNSARGYYLFNSTIVGLEEADFVLLIGTNLRHSSPVLNAKIGRIVRDNGAKVARIGEADDQTYPINELGDKVELLKEFLDDSSKAKIIADLKKAKNPAIIVGDGVMSRKDGYAILDLIHKIANKYNVIRPDWNGFNVIHNHASMVGALDIGFIFGNHGDGTEKILRQTISGETKILYIFGADDFDFSAIGKNCFVIYHGHHGDKGASRADVILPSAAYTEQDGMYVNIEGRVQLARRAIQPPGVAMADWQILTELSGHIAFDLGVLDLSSVRNLMAKELPVFAHIDEIARAKFASFTSKDKLLDKPISRAVVNYYMTDVISRASVTMAKCAKEREKLEQMEGA